MIRGKEKGDDGVPPTPHQRPEEGDHSYRSMKDNEETSTDGDAPPAASPLKESHTRSIVKGLTWRITATATTTIIALAITGQWEAALQIGLFEFLAKLLLYYLHERLWTRIRL